ncbi:MAG: ECF transporter S component [Actinobacteria bacterium]|nr:ECF transporter S component [Actinomycetota bacterium]
MSGRTGGLPQVGLRSGALLAATFALGVVAFGWPFLASRSASDPPGPARTGGTGSGTGGTASVSSGSHAADAVWFLAGITLLVLAMVLTALLDGSTDLKAVALLGVLAAAGAALRPLGAGAAGIEPMFVVLILGGRILGPLMGFALGSTAMFASSLLVAGVGPWLPFQMLAAAWVAAGAGMLPGRVRGRGETALLAGYALLAGLGFGAVMNLWFWPFSTTASLPFSYRPDGGLAENLHRYAAFYLATSLGWDLPRGLLNATLVVLAGPRIASALRRAVRRAAFDVPVRFEPATPAPGAGPAAKGA